MGILTWLFTRKHDPPRCAIVIGDGQFKLHVASDAKHRARLKASGVGTHRYPALLIPQLASPRGSDTVAVRIGEMTVGYLHPTDAQAFLTALRAAKFDRAACGAMVDGVPDGDLTHYRVQLDATIPFKLEEPPSR